MSELEKWIGSIKEQEIFARNKSRSEGLALCFNFIEIPKSDGIVAFTISVMLDGKRRNAMNPISFARIMNDIEGSLYNVAETCSVTNSLCCCSVVKNLSKDWYRVLRCHRLFFIPKEHMWDVIREVFDSSGLECFHNSDAREVVVYLNTDDYRSTIKFY